MSLTQFIYLFKRDFHAARRTRGIMMMFILMPIVLWGFQIILPLIRLGIVNGLPEIAERQTQALIQDNTNPLDVSIDLGLPATIAILLTFMSIIPYVAAAIAGEREKKTMESLLSLPVSRLQILLAKFAVGACLGTLSLVINIILFWVYMYLTNTIIAPANDWTSAAFMVDLNLAIIPAISLTLFLCMLLNLGIGLSIASLAKSAETSRQLFTLILLPLMLFIPVILFTGLPEGLSASMNTPLPLVIYFIPWTHALAIFQKILLPPYFTNNSLFLLPLEDVGLDIVFHLGVIFLSLIAVMWAASKVFEREGLVN